MYRFLISIFIFTFIFSLDTDWKVYQNHEISINKVIIKIDNNMAPKLGLEQPLEVNDIEGLVNLRESNNFNNLKPLFRNYLSFTEDHYKHDLHQYYILSFINPENNILGIADKINQLPLVEEVSFNYKMKAFVTPNDTYYDTQWALNNTGQAISYNGNTVGTPGADIDAERAWDITTGSSDVVIAILDTGIDLDHPDLQSGIVGGYDFVSNDSNANDGNMHGTACASIAAGRTNNLIGVSGICWNCSLMPVKVLSDDGYGDFDDIINGVVWASDNGAQVVSMSLGGGGYVSSFDNAIDYAHDNGTIVISASGNDNGSISYPAAYENSVAVGAMSPCNERKSYSSCDGENFWGSNYGNGLDFVAPGVRIHSATIGGYTTTFNGTSSACPHAAGVAGLIYSIAPGMPPSEVRLAMQINSVDIGSLGYDNQTGWGRLNAYNAVSNLAEQPDVEINVDSFDIEMSANQILTESFVITNTLEGEADLEYSIAESEYKWIDSNETGSSNWVTLDNPIQVVFDHNDDAASPVDLGFDFPFYDNNYNQCTINPNGWVGFGGDSNAWDNSSLPADVPNPAIFGFWDDLNPVNNANSSDMSGYVYYQQFEDSFVIFFDQVVHWVGSGSVTGTYTFQIILHNDGKIDLNYQEMIGSINTATIGVQASNSEYIQIAYNSNYTEPNMSSYILPPAEWFSLSLLNGTINPGNSDIIDITIDTEGLTEGVYFDVISIETNDYDSSSINIPFTLNVTDICGGWTIGDVNQDSDFNVQDVIIMLNIVLSPENYNECQIFVSDLNEDGSINIQDIILLVNIILS